jgi:hypothetical protein
MYNFDIHEDMEVNCTKTHWERKAHGLHHLVKMTRMRVLPRRGELTTWNGLQTPDGGKIERSAEALLN